MNVISDGSNYDHGKVNQIKYHQQINGSEEKTDNVNNVGKYAGILGLY